MPSYRKMEMDDDVLLKVKDEVKILKAASPMRHRAEAVNMQLKQINLEDRKR